MTVFRRYSEYYDLMYRDKDYKGEACYIDSLIRRYAGHSLKRVTMLDIGCGTGQHDQWFSDKGYKVTGIDKSPEMIKIARKEIGRKAENAKFHVSDSTSFNLNKRFDIAVALFHVIGYNIDNISLLKTFSNIHKHLKMGGLFVFDFWYGPAVFAEKPTLKKKVVSDDSGSIERIAVPKIDVNADTVSVNYTINIRGREGTIKKKIVENHVMRYFFLPELYFMLETAGFRVIKCLKWMSLREDLDENSWSGVIISSKDYRV